MFAYISIQDVLVVVTTEMFSLNRVAAASSSGDQQRVRRPRSGALPPAPLSPSSPPLHPHHLLLSPDPVLFLLGFTRRRRQQDCNRWSRFRRRRGDSSRCISPRPRPAPLLTRLNPVLMCCARSAMALIGMNS